MEINSSQIINSMRVMAIDAIEKANSGHPGTPLGVAPTMYTLFTEHLKHNPKNSKFFNRDRFALSIGHASALLYSMLHLSGYDISNADIQNFRQIDSKTPGHPELGVTDGVDISTGPLGQGIANAVGFALAEKMMANKFNKPDNKIVDYYTYALCGDGCMQEGVQYEAASLAGAWKLGKMILIYDKNNITIEGDIDGVFDEDVASRYESQGWHVQKVASGEDIAGISKAIQNAKDETEKPSLIIVRSVIGQGSSKENNASSHGAPLGAEVIKEYKTKIGWDYDLFEYPASNADYTKQMCEKGELAESKWLADLAKYKKDYPDDYAEFEAWLNGKPNLYDMPELWENIDAKDTSTRNLSSIVLNKIAKRVPNIVGGSADLGPSNKTVMSGVGFFGESETGRNLHFGVREMAMSAICNALSATGAFFPYCSTFFVFSDYMKGGIRMSALMELPVLYIFSHDSIAVGEDGPTHEPIEHLASLRALPNVEVWRPSSPQEIACAYAANITDGKTVILVTSRQGMDLYDLEESKNAKLGGYILVKGGENPDVILMASGSEVGLALKSAKALDECGVNARVVSMPSQEVFDRQSCEYKESVLPRNNRARIAIEAGVDLGWYKYVGLDGECISIDRFGESAPAHLLFEKYGFTVDNVVATSKRVIKNLK